jgi:hypothetical protein
VLVPVGIVILAGDRAIALRVRLALGIGAALVAHGLLRLFA